MNRKRIKTVWTIARRNQLIKIYPTASWDELFEQFSFANKSSIACMASELQIKKLGRFKIWTSYEIKLLKKLYPDVQNPKLMIRFNCTESQLSNRSRKIGLRKSVEFMADPKNRNYFSAGSIPVNKGKKWDEFMSKEAQDKSRKTTFKKGNIPANTLYDGIITIRHNHKERNYPPYMWIRISVAEWKMYHVYLWEKENGPVPKGHIIIFRDGDTMNVELSNLEKITKAENLDRNGHWKARELTDEYVAMVLSYRNKELKKELLKTPEILEVHRLNIKLKRTIKHENSRQTEKA